MGHFFIIFIMQKILAFPQYAKPLMLFNMQFLQGRGGAALIIVTAQIIVTMPGIVTINLIVAKRFNKHLTQNCGFLPRNRSILGHTKKRKEKTKCRLLAHKSDISVVGFNSRSL